MKEFTVILLKLPDGRLILQRRTDDASYGPNKLGLFGGWMEGSETPAACVKRELREETSLPVDKLDITFVTDFIVPKGGDFREDRRFYLFSTEIPNADFEVYEGKRAETFTVEEVKLRSDLVSSSYFAFHKVLA